MENESEIENENETGVERERRSKSQLNRLIAIAVFLAVLGIAVLIISGILKSHGYGGKYGVIVGVVGLFLCEIVSLVILFNIYPDCMMNDLEKTEKKYNAVAMTKLHKMSKMNIEETFIKNGFKSDESGYLKGKKTSFAKGEIGYYIRNENAPDADMGRIEMQALEYLEGADKKCRNSAVILFIHKSRVNSVDLDKLRDFSVNKIVAEKVFHPQCAEICMTVLIDSMTGEGYFLDMGESIAIYNYACKLVKKYFM